MSDEPLIVSGETAPADSGEFGGSSPDDAPLVAEEHHRPPGRPPVLLIALAVCGLIAMIVGGMAATGILRWPASGGAAQDSALNAPSAAERPELAEPGPDPSPHPTETDAAGLRIASLPDASWVHETAARFDIPERALRAYAGAALAIEQRFPSCGLGWNTLAGIGEVESAHGTLRGGKITAGGRVEPELVGVPLDGDGVDHIGDTDGGALDGDAELDRAVGPMQFTPQTWAEYGEDGNGDGVRDPQHIDDAALSAAAYLCAVGGDLTVPENWLAAVHAYNVPVEYVARVSDAATRYAS